MSNGFKLTVVTVSLVVSILVSGPAVFAVFMNFAWTDVCSGICIVYAWLIGIAPLSFISYIAFLKTKKDIFFWFEIGLLVLSFLFYFGICFIPVNLQKELNFLFILILCTYDSRRTIIVI